MTRKEFGVADAKKHFSEILGRVVYGGERITISKRGKPLAVLIPPGSEESKDHLGEVAGWLDNEDPFFDFIDEIVQHRANHIPRILSRSGE